MQRERKRAGKPAQQGLSERQRVARQWEKAAVWATGRGDFWLLAPCGGELTITRWRTLAEAEREKARLNKIQCGRACWPSHHRILDLSRLRERKAPTPYTDALRRARSR